jgi:hypothetical protein
MLAKDIKQGKLVRLKDKLLVKLGWQWQNTFSGVVMFSHVGSINDDGEKEYFPIPIDTISLMDNQLVESNIYN